MNEEVQAQNNALAVAENSQMLTADIFAGSSDGTTTRKATSIDINDEESVDMLLNSLQDVDHKLNDMVDQEIKCVGFYAVERPVTSFNEESGEAITRFKHVLMLFDEKGESYVTGSNACYSSFNDIVSIKGLPTKENPIVLKPIKVDAKEKGHSYLKLKVVINKK